MVVVVAAMSDHQGELEAEVARGAPALRIRFEREGDGDQKITFDRCVGFVRAEERSGVECIESSDCVQRLVDSYTEREAFGDAFGSPVTLNTLVSEAGVSGDAWTLFANGGIRDQCPWMFDAACAADLQEPRADAKVPSQLAFLFSRWAEDEGVHHALAQKGLLCHIASHERDESDAGIAEEIVVCEHESPRDDDDAGDTDPPSQGVGITSISDAGERECDRLLLQKFGASDEVVADMKINDDPGGGVFYKWSSITKVARVGNPNFKKFKATKRFAECVPAGLSDACKKVGTAHMLSASLAAKVLTMCDKAEV